MESKRGSAWLWGILILIVVIILGIGGYLYIHNQQPMLKKEGGNDYYVKGMVYERTLFGWRTYSGDKCDGDSLQEKIVNKDSDVIGRYYTSFESFNCLNGCQDGACIR
tara:strand:+ start:155 stop:478 length:324 start_codon:yes stop_codon:yes gene_type:complete